MNDCLHSWVSYRWYGNSEGYVTTEMICQNCFRVKRLEDKESSNAVGKITDPLTPEADRIAKEKPPIVGLENILKKHKAEV